MSRTLFVMRHAKSSWETGETDHRRPLNLRGERDGVVAGAYLAERCRRIDRVLCSSARRTGQTWERAVVGGAAAREVSHHDEIYEASPSDLLPLLRGLPAGTATALVLGHLPGVAQLVDLLAVREETPARERFEEKFPTSGIATIEFAGDWTDLAPQSGRLVEFAVPRADRNRG
ncbi:histidine phosphatase family protein [Leucobacter weissii]|uniref:Histidine phosphatase family protein n=1 Tax=Leucobacter weissii TaxID=1983706 RepID=A0A939SCI6_9MICO|nr:histidine phosphatase family protein [Leucobacter weissii]MBO1902398.1 histidine phosphatase family protein [Leucobacter weissii]